MDDVMVYVVQKRADLKSRLGSSLSPEGISQCAFLSLLSMMCSCQYHLCGFAVSCKNQDSQHQPTQTVHSAKN